MRGVNAFIVSLSLCASALLTACSRPTPPLKWTEEVQIPNGPIVTLTRYQEFKGPHEIGDTPTESDYWFEMKHPITGELVRWTSNRDLSTLALLMTEQTLTLLVKPEFGGHDRLGCPNPPYLLFRYEHSSWTQVPIAELPIKVLRVNMTYSPKTSRRLIESSGMHLTSTQTLNSMWGGQKPYKINFNKMTQQTFDKSKCY